MADVRTDAERDSMAEHPFAHTEHLRLFLWLVRRHLGRDGRRVQIQDGVATVEGSDVQMGLQNLAQICNLEPPQEWPDIIGPHLDLSDAADVKAMAAMTLGSPYAQLAGQLALRIHPEDYLANMEQHVLHRCDLPGTVTVLVIDLPRSVMAVPTPIADGWGVPREQLFARALQNVVAMGPTPWTELPLPPVMRLDALMGQHTYIASHALRLGQCLPRIGRHGNLIAVPHRHILLSHPIDGDKLVPSVEALQLMAEGMHREGPGSISPHLFWRRPDGVFELQRNLLQGGRRRLVATPDFARLMQQAGGA